MIGQTWTHQAKSSSHRATVQNMVLMHSFQILVIKESCKLAGRENFVLLLAKQNFVRYGICTEKQRIVRSFISCYFQQSNEWQNWWWQKVMLELMKTQENCVNCRPVLSPFYLFFGKQNFFLENRLEPLFSNSKFPSLCNFRKK